MKIYIVLELVSELLSYFHDEEVEGLDVFDWYVFLIAMDFS